MVTLFKIILFLVAVGAGFLASYIIGEYRKYLKSEVAETSSRLEGLAVGSIAFVSTACMIAISIFLALMVFSSITIQLPW